MGEILQTISVVVAALAVALSVTAWRRTELGKRRIELAEETLALFYEARGAIRMIRSPFGTVGEGKTRKRGEGEREEEAELRDRAYVAFERHQKKEELFARLGSLRHRFRAYFGEASCQPFDDLNAIIHEIFLAAHMLATMWIEQGRYVPPERAEDHLQRMHAAEEIFWEAADPDPLNPRIDRLMGDIERTCKSVINPHPTLCSICRDWYDGARRFWLCRG